MFVAINGKDRDPSVKSIWVDRRSILGNPYQMRDKSESERNRVITDYRIWLWTEMQVPGVVYKALMDLITLESECGTVHLMCWCKPKACHADILVNALNWMKTQI
ncbi:MAG: DUF4326 domain-containing protein [Syntrophobacteraceae bacterium]